MRRAVTRPIKDRVVGRGEIEIGGEKIQSKEDVLPKSGRRFRNAWNVGANDNIEVDLDKAKEILVADLWREKERQRVNLSVENLQAQVLGKKLPAKKAKLLESLERPLNVDVIRDAKTIDELDVIDLDTVLQDK